MLTDPKTQTPQQRLEQLGAQSHMPSDLHQQAQLAKMGIAAIDALPLIELVMPDGEIVYVVAITQHGEMFYLYLSNGQAFDYTEQELDTLLSQYPWRTYLFCAAMRTAQRDNQ